MTSTSPLHVQEFSSIQEIPKDHWNQLCSGVFPFERWEHFAALEESGCVGEEAGWSPLYLVAFEGEQPLGATYLFQKTHSYGEYIFDWQWAGIAEQLNTPYYPKLTSAVPFTPATGAKLMLHAQAESSSVRRVLIEKALQLSLQRGLSGLHFLFIAPEEISSFEDAGLLVRETFQFHWRNHDYTTFEDFLAALRQKRSKEIRRERRQVLEQGIEFAIHSADELSDEWAEFLYASYLQTIDKKQSFAYLNLDYFQRVFASMGDQVRLFVALDGGKKVACSLCYHQGDRLFGRYWGALQEYRGLHFELCYYRPMEYAIENGVRLFEAGAQGSHKIQRGFLPEKTYSAHLCHRTPLDRFVEQVIRHENHALEQGLKEFFLKTPYR